MKLIRLLILMILFVGTSPVKSQSIFNIYNTTPTQFCYGDYAMLNVDFSTLPPGDWRFEWYRTNLTDCHTGAALSQVHDPNSAGWTIAFETGSYHCIGYDVLSGNSAYSFNSIMVRCLPNPSVPGSPSALPAPLSNGATQCVSSVTFCVPDFMVDQPNVYRWYQNNVQIPGATASSYTATSSGYYKYQLIGSCNSPFSDSVYVTVNSGITRQITAGGSTSICPGETVVLTASTGPGYTFRWYRNGVLIQGATQSNYTVTSGGTYECYIGNDICPSEPSNSIFINVYSVPLGSLTGLDLTYGIASPPDTLAGSPAGGLFSGPGMIGNVFHPSLAGNGYHTITYTFISSNGCTVSRTANTTVCSPPAAQITAAGPVTFCQGGNVRLDVATVSGATYQWYKNGAVISGATGYYYTVTTTGDYTCNVTRSVCGTSTSNTISVTVNPRPTVSFSGLATSYTTVSAPVTLTGSPAGGTFSGPGISGNVFSPSVAGAGTHTITYSYTNSYGCSRSTTRTTTVSLCNTPVPSASISGTLTPCANSTGVVYTCAPVSGAASYNWTVPGNVTIVSGQGTNSLTLNFGASFTQGTINVSVNNGCAWSTNTSLTVYSIPIAPITLTGPMTGVCSGSTNVAYSVSLSPGATSFTWTSTSGITITSGQGTSQITAKFGQNFSSGKINVTASNACGTSAPSSWTIRSKPVTPGAISGPASFCSNQQGVVYSIASVAGASYYNWQVPTGASIVSGQGTTTITVNYGNKAGYIKVAAGNVCGLSAYKQLKVSKTCREGIFNEEPLSVKPSVYPNPSSDKFNLITALADGEKALLSIFDTNGKLVFAKQIEGAEFLIDGQILTPGMYQIILSNGAQVEKLKIIKTE